MKKTLATLLIMLPLAVSANADSTSGETSSPRRVIVYEEECNDADWTEWQTWTTGTITFLEGFYGGMGYTRGIDVERRFSRDAGNSSWQMRILNYHSADARDGDFDELIIQYDPVAKKIFIPTQDFGMRTAVEDSEGVKGIPGYITGYTTYYPDRTSDIEYFDELEGEMQIHTVVYWDGLLLDDGTRGEWVITESVDKIKLDGFTDYNVHIIADECVNSKSATVKFDFTEHPHGVCYGLVQGLATSGKIDEIADSGTNQLENPMSVEFQLENGLNTVVAISYDRQEKRYVNLKEIYCMPDEEGEWKSIGKGTFTEDAVSGLSSNMGVPSFEVDVEESMTAPGLYRMVNPYLQFADKYTGLSHHEGHNHYIYFDASIPTQVMLAQCATGVHDEKLGDIYLTSRAYEEMEAGAMRIEYAKYMGTLDNGIISFPQDAIGVKLPGYVKDNIWWTNSSACFGLRLPAPSGLEQVDAVTETSPEYRTLQGICVSAPVAGEIYIVVRGNKVTKELYLGSHD